MTHKKVDNLDSGTIDRFGGNDLDKWSDFASGVDTDDYDINSDTQYRYDKFQIRNSSNTSGHKHRSLATVARTITYPDADITVGEGGGGGGLSAGGQISFNGTAAQTVFNIPHGLGVTPDFISVEPASTDAFGSFTRTKTSTNIVITYQIPPPLGTSNVTFQWGAGDVDVATGGLTGTSTTTLTNKTMSNDDNTFPYVGAYNAIIYKSGTVYKSKRFDGTVLASSTVLDSVVQAALDEKGLILWPEAAGGGFYQPSNVAAWNIHEKTRLIMGCNILVSSAYASTLFTIDDTTPTSLTQKNIFIDGGNITQAGATPTHTWTGIELKSNSDDTSGGSGGITSCKFSNIWMNKPGTGIKLSANSGANSWINGNVFDNITVANCHIGFDFNCTDVHPTNQSAHRNTFINCIAQADPNNDTQDQFAMIYGFHNIQGRQNTFYHCQAWDTTDSNISCNIKPSATDTVIAGGLMTNLPMDWEITQDLGVRTILFPAQGIHGAAGYNAAITNPFIQKTGTWSGYCGTGPTASVGDGLLNAMGTTTAASGVYSKPTPTSDGQPAMMDTGATANVPVGFRTQVNVASRYFNPFYKCRFKLNQTTAQRIFVGFASTTTPTIGTADDPLVSLSGYGLYHSTTHGTSATNWLYTRNNGAANSTFVDSGIAANVTTPQTVLTAGYEFTGGSPPPPYFIARVGTNAASAKATTTIPAQFTEMNVGCWLSNPSGQKTCNVYSMFFKNGRPDPF